VSSKKMGLVAAQESASPALVGPQAGRFSDQSFSECWGGAGASRTRAVDLD
jgi:hypothetical protein